MGSQRSTRGSLHGRWIYRLPLLADFAWKRGLHECHAESRLSGSRASTLDVDAETKDFFSYTDPISGKVDQLLRYCICVPYRDDYYERTDTFGKTLLENWHRVASITILYFDEEAYQRTDRLLVMGIQIKYGTIEFPGMEGFKVGLYTPFSQFDYSEYHFGN